MCEPRAEQGPETGAEVSSNEASGGNLHTQGNEHSSGSSELSGREQPQPSSVSCEGDVEKDILGRSLVPAGLGVTGSAPDQNPPRHGESWGQEVGGTSAASPRERSHLQCPRRNKGREGRGKVLLWTSNKTMPEVSSSSLGPGGGLATPSQTSPWAGSGGSAAPQTGAAGPRAQPSPARARSP